MGNTQTLLILGGLAVGAYLLWQTVGKDWALNKAGDIATKFNTDPVFRNKLENIMEPIYKSQGKEVPRSNSYLAIYQDKISV